MRKIIFDFDDVIVNSKKAYCDVYNKKYKNHANFKKADYRKVYRWDLLDECPLEKDLQSIFGCRKFKQAMKLNKNAKKYLKLLKDKTDVIICSNSNYKNMIIKAEFIEENIPFVTDTILLTNSKVINKGYIDMSGCIFVDDNEENLNLSNADIKICFGADICECNKNWKGLRARNWDELYTIILMNLNEDIKENSEITA